MSVKIKFLIAFYLIITLCVLSLSACQKPETRDEKIEIKELIDNKVGAYKTDLIDSKEALDSNDKIAEYLVNWANSKGIRVRNESGVVVMSVDSSIDYKDAKHTVIVCPYDKAQFKAMADPIVMAMYILKNNEETGALTALFVPESGHDFSGITTVKKKYIPSGSRVVCLNPGTKGMLASTCGASSSYSFSAKPKATAPKHSKAYKIVISDLDPKQADNDIRSRVNPIIELNSFLASLKNSSIDFEISKFIGGGDGVLTPGNASIVITVDSDKQERFLERLDKRISSFESTAGKDDDDIVYQYREITPPTKVVNQRDSYKLVSFLYTLLKGEYKHDEETDILVAIDEITGIKVLPGKSNITSVAYSIDEDTLNEIDEAEETLCGLSGFKFKKTGSTSLWQAVEESSVMTGLASAYEDYTGKELKLQLSVTPTNANFISGINKKCEVATLIVSSNTLKDLTGTFIDFLMNANAPEAQS